MTSESTSSICTRLLLPSSIWCSNMALKTALREASIALCILNSLLPHVSVTSEKFGFSNKLFMSSLRRHSGILNRFIDVCPLMLTLSATTLTSEYKVSLSSGRRPFDSSSKKSRRMNFLKPQSLPWTNLYALWLS